MATIFQSKKSVLAVKKEVTEGTPVFPTAGSDFIPIQEDVAYAPNFEVLENAELTGSLSAPKPILGFEDPTSSLSLYLKHSGSEGVAPNWSDLAEASFGAISTAGAEFDTIGGSTTTVIKVDTAEGGTFEVGEALLIKDSVEVGGGFAIRTIKSISTDDLTLDFALGTAPGTGVTLGKAILYKPGETHPSLTLTDFRGDGFAIQQIAGARVTEHSISITAGELANQSFSLGGLKYNFNPIEITSTSNKIDFVDDTGTFAASVTAKTYKDPRQLADAIAAAMNLANGSGGDVITVIFNNKGASAGKFTISSDGAVTFSLLWKTGVSGSDNTDEHIGTKIGFDDSADDTSSFSYTSDSVQDYASGFTVSFDSTDPIAAKNFRAFLGDQADTTCFQVNTLTFTLADTRATIDEVCAETGRDSSLITDRLATVELTAFLDQHDAEKFQNFRQNDTVQFLLNFGNKTGDDFVAGKSGCIAIHSATITSFELADLDGLVVMNASLTAFVASGVPETFLNFV